MAEHGARVTMSDVAQAAGVSTKTVSNVLRDTSSSAVSQATRERVLAAASRLGYRLNRAAAALRSGRHGSIALAIPTLQQPTYALLAADLMKAAGHTQVLLELTAGSAQREAALLAGSWTSQCDALVMVPRSTDPCTITPTPGLMLLADDGPPDIPRVTCPPVAQTLLLASHLHQAGCRSVAVFGVDEAADRWSLASVHGLREAGLEVPDQALVTVGAPDGVRGGVEAASRLLHCGPQVDAVICHNDAIASGAAATFTRRGIRVPDDVIVIGRGNTETAAFSSPSLTSVSCATGAVAQETMRMLNSIAQGDSTGGLVEVAPTLTVRESSTR